MKSITIWCLLICALFLTSACGGNDSNNASAVSDTTENITTAEETTTEKPAQPAEETFESKIDKYKAAFAAQNSWSGHNYDVSDKMIAATFKGEDFFLNHVHYSALSDGLELVEVSYREASPEGVRWLLLNNGELVGAQIFGLESKLTKDGERMVNILKESYFYNNGEMRVLDASGKEKSEGKWSDENKAALTLVESHIVKQD